MWSIKKTAKALAPILDMEDSYILELLSKNYIIELGLVGGY